LTYYTAGFIKARRLSASPVIIGGCERSGTTLLHAIISAHPRIHAINDETWAFCYGPPAGFGGDQPIRKARLYKYLGTERIRPEAIRWCEKSPANIFYFPVINEHFANNVRMIQIVRDGRDVVTSRHPRKPTEPWVSIDRWKAAVSAGLAYRDHPDVLTIRYEDLVLDYSTTIAKVFAFIGEKLTKEMLDWHRHATVTTSFNLMGGTVPTLHHGAIRKFERPECIHREKVDLLMADSEAVALLETYGFKIGIC
jgi:hypothetical protein